MLKPRDFLLLKSMIDDIYKFKKGQLFRIDGEDAVYKVVGWDISSIVLILAENVETKEIFSFGYRNIKDAPLFRKIPPGFIPKNS
jgi:hypothetical protein